MRKYILPVATLLLVLTTFSGCKKYLDINQDPDTPQTPDPSSVFPTQLAAIPRGTQYDARYVGRYIQNWLSVSTGSAANVNWDRMGYASGSDAGGDIWRQTYYGLGRNLEYIITQGTTNQQWDYVGAALALKSMIFQMATDQHGEIIWKEAFFDQALFRFDDQESVYKGVDSMCRLAVYYLNRTDGNPGAAKLAKADYVYSGNTARWTKFVYGILARNFHRLTNKSTYSADSVIKYCNLSLSSIADDFVVPFDAQKNDDANFFGTFRDNLTVLRQSNFIVRLLDGSTLTGVPATTATAYNRDPRMRHMLSASHDSTTTNGNGGYRGVDPGLGDPADATQALSPWYTYAFNSTNYLAARRKVAAPWGDTIYTNPSVNNFSTAYRKYLFGDKVVSPVMTASEIQFIKAEAAMRAGDAATAYTAYIAGINLHFDFINRSSFPRSNAQLFTGSPISTAERNAYLASANVKQSSGALRLQDIMLQKYIALWGWGFFETFVDMRRYHWTDIDPVAGTQVYLGFSLPGTIAPENLGKPVYRLRPRFNSEYVWNRDELLRIGALNGDYHTYETWFVKP
jgi:hypothetical protein